MNDPREDARWALELVMRLVAPAQCVHAIVLRDRERPAQGPRQLHRIGRICCGRLSGLDRRYFRARPTLLRCTKRRDPPSFQRRAFGRTTNPLHPIKSF